MIGTVTEVIIYLLKLRDAGDTKTYEVKEHKRGRSLTQNGYYWQLLSQTARLLKMSNTELHNQMLAEFGQVDEDIKQIIMLDSIDWRTLPHMHLRPTAATRTLDNGKLYRVYYVMRGSSTYNTTEMSRLLDGMIEEAKAQGIETLPPHMLEGLNGGMETNKRDA